MRSTARCDARDEHGGSEEAVSAKLLNRRSAVKCSIAALATIALFGAEYASAHGKSLVRFGAFRWDPWYGPASEPDSAEWYAVHDLDPAPFHTRAPFFAQPLDVNSISIKGVKSDVEQELLYAAYAGIKFWIFLWYPHGRAIHLAWEYYHASRNRRLVNWAILIGINSLAQGFPSESTLTGLFRQSCYERAGLRPLLFLLHEPTNEGAAAAAALVSLRKACVSRGVADPYVVVLSGVPEKAFAAMRVLGADAIGAYASAPPTSGHSRPYKELDDSVRSSWTRMVETGAEVIPGGMTGWDRRPRIQRQPPFDKSIQGLTLQDYIVPGTVWEIAQHVFALKQFIIRNQESCRTKIGLLYSWNECDEGGNVLCPTWSPSGANDSLLHALKRVLL